MKADDPNTAQEFDDFVLKRNEIDDLMKMEIDPNEVKFYPGSLKGPRPEDDPRSYT